MAYLVYLFDKKFTYILKLFYVYTIKRFKIMRACTMAPSIDSFSKLKHFQIGKGNNRPNTEKGYKSEWKVTKKAIPKITM